MVNVIHQFNKLDYILVGQKITESLFIFIGESWNNKYLMFPHLQAH